jgi:hypothetical protein
LILKVATSNSAEHALAAGNRTVPTLGYRFSAIRTTPTTTFTAEFNVRSPMRRAMFDFDRARYLNPTNSAMPSKTKNTPKASKIVTRQG